MNKVPKHRSGGPGRSPDYTLSALDKQTEVKGQIGVAWINDDGRISIKLNPFLVLDTFRMDLTLSLFPNDRKTPYAEPADAPKGEDAPY